MRRSAACGGGGGAGALAISRVSIVVVSASTTPSAETSCTVSGARPDRFCGSVALRVANARSGTAQTPSATAYPSLSEPASGRPRMRTNEFGGSASTGETSNSSRACPVSSGVIVAGATMRSGVPRSRLPVDCASISAGCSSAASATSPARQYDALGRRPFAGSWLRDPFEASTLPPLSRLRGRMSRFPLLLLRAAAGAGPLDELLEQAFLLGRVVGRDARRLHAGERIVDEHGLAFGELAQLLFRKAVAGPARHFGREIDAAPLRVIGRLLEVAEPVEIEVDETLHAPVAVAVLRPVEDGEHSLHTDALDGLARRHVARIILARERGGYVQVVELFERDRQEMEAEIVLHLGEEVVGLADGVHERGDLAGLHLLDGDGVVDENRLHLHAHALEQDRCGHGGAGARRVEAHPLALEILEALDLGPHQHVDLGDVHFRDEVHALLDVRDLLDGAEVLEHVGMRDGDVDTLEIEQVLDVVRGAGRHHRQDAQVVRAVEVARDLRGKAQERTFGQAAGETHRPVVDLGDEGAFTKVDRRRHGDALRFPARLGLGDDVPRRRGLRTQGGRGKDAERRGDESDGRSEFCKKRHSVPPMRSRRGALADGGLHGTKPGDSTRA